MDSLIIMFSNQVKQDRSIEMAFNDLSLLIDEFYSVESLE